MSKRKLPCFIGLTVEEVQSQLPSVRRKVRRAFVHNAGILYGPEGQEAVKGLLDLGRERAGASRRNAGNAKPSN
jgi:hypothetical protein